MSTQLNEILDFVSNGLEVVQIKLVRDRNDLDDDSINFSPEYAHQVFGEHEKIFGYRDLKVRIFYTAGPLNIYLGCKYSARIDERDGYKADDVTGKISELLTSGCYFTSIDEFFRLVKCYERYTNSEGKTMYATVGYTTVYSYYAFPEHIRPRISQMLVLPPFQKLGIGSRMVQVIYNRFRTNQKVVDITVEDPSDNFRRIRNSIDVGLCKDLNAFSPDKIKNGFTREMVKEANKNFKINPKQCRIVYEILRLRCTNVHDEKEYEAYRLDVKRRLNTPYYKQIVDLKKLEKAGQDFNKISVGITTPQERMEQLKIEFKELEEEYRLIIDKLN